MSRMYSHDYTVEGFGDFPIDMLRYDSSYPFNSQDVEQISLPRVVVGGNKRRQVRLAHTGPAGWKPTSGRWESFGWKVLQHGRNPY